MRVKFTTNPMIRHEIGLDFSTGERVLFTTDPYHPALEKQRREDEKDVARTAMTLRCRPKTGIIAHIQF